MTDGSQVLCLVAALTNEPSGFAAQQEIAAGSDGRGLRLDAEFVVRPPLGLLPFVVAAGWRILRRPCAAAEFQGVGWSEIMPTIEHYIAYSLFKARQAARSLPRAITRAWNRRRRGIGDLSDLWTERPGDQVFGGVLDILGFSGLMKRHPARRMCN